MQRTFLIFVFLVFNIFVMSAQSTEERQREKYEKEVQEKQNELIDEFVDGLEADEFQKEIITQKLHSYIQKKQAIIRTPGSNFDKRDQYDYLDDTHFADISNMVSNDVMLEIRDFITLKHTQKKKKKKRKSNRQKSSDSTNQNI